MKIDSSGGSGRIPAKSFQIGDDTPDAIDTAQRI